jgi:hypothetical protein
VLPIDPTVRCFHMGDINELGNIVAGAFAHPDETGAACFVLIINRRKPPRRKGD